MRQQRLPSPNALAIQLPRSAATTACASRMPRMHRAYGTACGRMANGADAPSLRDSLRASTEAARIGRIGEEARVRHTPPAEQLSSYVQSFVDAVSHGDAGAIKATASLSKTRDDFAAIVKERQPSVAKTAAGEVALDGDSAHQDFMIA